MLPPGMARCRFTWLLIWSLAFRKYAFMVLGHRTHTGNLVAIDGPVPMCIRFLDPTQAHLTTLFNRRGLALACERHRPVDGPRIRLDERWEHHPMLVADLPQKHQMQRIDALGCLKAVERFCLSIVNPDSEKQPVVCSARSGPRLLSTFLSGASGVGPRQTKWPGD